MMVELLLKCDGLFETPDFFLYISRERCRGKVAGERWRGEVTLCVAKLVEPYQREMGENGDIGMPKRTVFVTVGTTCFDALVRAVDTQEVKQELSRKGYTHLLIQMGRGSYIPTKPTAAGNVWDNLWLIWDSRRILAAVLEQQGKPANMLEQQDTSPLGGDCLDALRAASLSERTCLEVCPGFDTGAGVDCVARSGGEDGTLAVDYFTFSSSIADHLKSASLVVSHAGSGSIFETLRLGKPLIVVVNEDLMDNHQSELAEELAERKHLFYARPQTLLQTITDMNLESIVPYPPADATPVAKLINMFLGFQDD
ncbi:hypothetical protein HHK36_026183 [Tetracentron sinense]|uniref:Glycosyl transferase family 28 C-terminal domain-containing protein n=1 Tax=Tetracentron sinense TaxID=13715 RepID=A0A835D3V6_TETSI|nr:hypothetical protein HHK36_026183 [Tetracentron sinense]